MRALVLPAENQMPAIAEVPQPEPADDQVLVKVSACGVNYADTMIRRGLYVFRPRFPSIPGFEFSGAVLRGAGAWTEGDTVMGLGSECYAEFVSAPASALLPVPAGFSELEAAAFPVTYLTAMGMLRLSVQACAGETILVHAAAGGVGTASIQLAKALGLTVIAAASTEQKLALARELGADFTIDYDGADLAEPILEFTSNRGVDIVFESLGGDSLTRDMELVAPFGKVVVFGAASGPTVDPPMSLLFRKSISVSGFWLPNLMRDQDALNGVLSELIEIVDRHELRPVIGKIYPLEQGAQAWTDMESRQSIGKLLLRP